MVNGRTVDIHITVHGSDWYYAVMSLMGTTMLIIIGLSLRRPRTHRVFHHILAAVAMVAMIEHYSMASNLGWVPIDVEWQRSNPLVSGVNRQIWWVRYCGWFLIWPLLSLTLCLTAVMPLANTIWTCFLSAVMAVMALVGAMVRSDFKWGYYGFWCACWFGLVFNLNFTVRMHANALGREVHRTFLASSSWILLLWMSYPVCWGLSEGGNVISPDSEFIFYGILDCCLIPVSSLVLLWGHQRIDPKRLGLYMRDYDDPLPGQISGLYKEKAELVSGDGGGGQSTATNDITNVAPVTEHSTPSAV